MIFPVTIFKMKHPDRVAEVEVKECEGRYHVSFVGMHSGCSAVVCCAIEHGFTSAKQATAYAEAWFKYGYAYGYNRGGEV